jgi:hypothetical protein
MHACSYELLHFFSRFQNAVNNKDKMTLTTPYLDPFGAGLMVDIVNTLYEGKSSGQHDTSDEVVAVLGASFDIFRFHRYVKYSGIRFCI